MALGDIVNKYETGGVGTSAISNTKGDKGGASYGRYQLSYNTGSLDEFMKLLQGTNKEAYDRLMPLWDSASQGKDGAFGKEWQVLAKEGKLQDTEGKYAYNTYIVGGLSNLRDKMLADRITNSPALQEAFLSTNTQHGAHGGAKIWNRMYQTGMADADLVRSIYNERGRTNPDGTLVHFSGNSPSVQRAVANRFNREVNDILGMLGSTPSNPNTPRPSLGDFNPNTNTGLAGVQPKQYYRDIRPIQQQDDYGLANYNLQAMNNFKNMLAKINATNQGLANFGSFMG